MGRNKILIVEDEVVIRTSLKKYLEKQSFRVTEAGSVQETEQMSFDEFDLIITDLRLPGAPGTELIKRAHTAPVVVITSYGSVASAVEAMKLGAADYIVKPFDFEALHKTVCDLIHPAGNEPIVPPPITGMLGTCDAMQDLFARIGKVAPTNTSVLIMGESGTGKELVARALHEGSRHAAHEMISLNCAAIPDTLIESELFGHEKGAFTGATTSRVGLVEAADNSTLFLDEIGELPLDAQARLLRVLQEGEVRRVGSVATKKVSIRLLAATHRDLKELTRRGEFREDLYYRLNVVKLVLPPLRERGDDITTLAEAILCEHARSLGKPDMRFAEETRQLIRRYRWPGNIRELENAIERAAILCDTADIPPELLAIETDGDEPEALTEDESLSLEGYFQQFVLDNQDSMTETELARKLGISRKALWQKRQKLNLPRERSRKI